jgi:hypothetical protein
MKTRIKLPTAAMLVVLTVAIGRDGVAALNQWQGRAAWGDRLYKFNPGVGRWDEFDTQTNTRINQFEERSRDEAGRVVTLYDPTRSIWVVLYPQAAFFRFDNAANFTKLLDGGWFQSTGGGPNPQPGVRFPIKVSTGYDYVTSRGKMKTQLTVDQNGMIHGDTCLRVTGIEGFTGAVGLVFLGENDTYLGSYVTRSWGVDCPSCIWAPHRGRRDVSWTVQFPQNQLPLLRAVVVKHRHDPKPFVQTLEHLFKQGNKAVDVVNNHGGALLYLTGAGAGM